MSRAKLQKRSGVRQKGLDQCTSSINTAEAGTNNAVTPQCAPRLYREHCLSECTSLSSPCERGTRSARDLRTACARR